MRCRLRGVMVPRDGFEPPDARGFNPPLYQAELPRQNVAFVHEAMFGGAVTDPEQLPRTGRGSLSVTEPLSRQLGPSSRLRLKAGAALISS